MPSSGSAKSFCSPEHSQEADVIMKTVYLFVGWDISKEHDKSSSDLFLLIAVNAAN